MKRTTDVILAINYSAKIKKTGLVYNKHKPITPKTIFHN